MEKKQKQINRENAVIKVVGVGGGGGNAVKRMINDDAVGVEFFSINTDNQVLENSKATSVLIGGKTTRGLGAGANPDIAKKAAQESSEDISKALEGADMVFIAAGMGGGTGTGAAPVVAQLAKDLGILTVGVITLPFAFEGRKRMNRALDGRKQMFDICDTLITIPNQKLEESADEKEMEDMSFEEAFAKVDEVLSSSCIGVSDLIKRPGNVNLDFADVQTIVRVGGSALMGVGEAKGENAALKAAELAMSNPLLQHGMTGAKGVIMNFKGPQNLKFKAISRAAQAVADRADIEAEVIFGHTVASEDEKWDEERVMVTIVATGFDDIGEGTESINQRNKPLSVPVNEAVLPTQQDQVVVGAPTEQASSEQPTQAVPYARRDTPPSLKGTIKVPDVFSVKSWEN